MRSYLKLNHQRFTLAFCCTVICLGMGPVALAEDVLSEKPLATSQVQPVTPQANSYEMTANVAVNRYQAPQMDSLSNYARAADGQWHIPKQVDRDNPWVRLMVLGSERPALIDIAIYVEGEPFTAAREKLIDKLLDKATLESLVRDAVNVPIPEDEAEGDSDSDKQPEEQTTDEELAEEEPAEEAKSKATEKVASEAESEDKETKDTELKAEKKEEKKEPDKSMVEVRTRQERTVAQRLVNYMASAEVNADREEIRWLLAEWTGGPAILTLGPAMSWQRVGFAPLWNALDVDDDDSLSESEIAAASERLGQADVDENSIVEIEELFALKTQAKIAPHGFPLIVVLDDETNWQQLDSYLKTAYGRRDSKQEGSVSSDTPTLKTRIANGDTTITPADLNALLEEPCDVRLRVSLGGQDKEEKTSNEVALLSATSDAYTASDQKITWVYGAEYLEFSAGELKEKELSASAATQVSIGAVVDGYPLFRLVDRNGDRRLSPRECRTLRNVLASLDLDADGSIHRSEKPTAIRIAITRGPHAHEMLSEPSAAERDFAPVSKSAPSDSPKPSAEVPPWFTDMDRNRDGDVSRSEFLGTSEQFKQLDVDGDGLIGSQEATN